MLTRIRFIFSVGIILLLCIVFSCKKKVSAPTNPVDQLPAATQTGANTFGCLVNGEVVVIHKPFGDLSPAYNCFYQLIYNSPTGYVFYISALDKTDGCHFKGVTIRLDSLALDQTTYLLNTQAIEGGHSAGYGYVNGCPPATIVNYGTDSTTAGKLIITHFDQQKQIVSGTFWFDAIGITRNDTVHVTDGRFDMHYTD